MVASERVIDAKEIRRAYRILAGRLVEGSKPFRRSITYRGGSVQRTVRWNSNGHFWFLLDMKESVWCPFGRQDPALNKPLSITCEINSSAGVGNRRYGGIFWLRSKDLYLGHTGRVGGGRTGIGKNAFSAWYKDRYGLGKSNEIEIGKLSSPGFVQQLAGFIRAVEQFKDEVANVSSVDEKLDRDAQAAVDEGDFDEGNLVESREKALRSINVRRGQPAFREKLLRAYDQRCAISGCDCQEVLEAAHIRPYGGDQTNHIQNGILLRGDIHTLFDLGKIGVEPNEFRIVVSKGLMTTFYASLNGRKLSLPPKPSNRPSKALLIDHLRSSKLP